MHFTCAESNANEQKLLFSLICIRFGTCKVRRLKRALDTLISGENINQLDQGLKARANARNIVGPNMLRAFAHHVVCCCVLLRLVATCWMKFETGQTSNKSQQHATTHNMVCKRSQHVGPNNVASCWPTMLRAFARAFTVFRRQVRPS